MADKGFLIRGTLRPRLTSSSGLGLTGPQAVSGKQPLPPKAPNRIPSSLTINRQNRGPAGRR